MALIKCPRCGQTVLSVASTCPKCSYLFLEAPKVESAAGALVECGSCSRRIPPDSASCPYCAYPIRRRRMLLGAGLAAAAVIIAVGGVVVLLTRGSEGGPAPPAVETRTAPEPGSGPVAVDGARRSDTAALDTSATRPTPLAAAPVRVIAPSQPRAARPDTTTTAPRRPAPTVASGVRQVRWSLDWVNVREGRGVDNAIVTVLRPGVEVQVADQRGGWWAVYVDGRFVGYAAGALFSAEPPAGAAT